jgi:hypothetical protein
VLKTAKVLALALLAFWALPAAAPPAWVLNQGADASTYPLETHLTGFGISSTPGDEARMQREAVAMAREALASAIRTQVDSVFVKQVTVRDQAMSSFAQSVVKTKASLELEGLDHYEFFRDTRKGLLYCLAILDRARTARLLGDRIARQSQECTRLFTRAKTGNELQNLLQLMNLVRKLDEDLVIYRVLTRAYPPDLAYPSRAEIGQELRRVLGAERGLDGYLGRAAFDLGLNLPEGIRVLVDRINYADTRFCGTLSAYVEQSLAENLVALGNAKILDKAAFKSVPEAAALPVSQAVVRGNYFDLGRDVKLVLYATATTGEELASASIQIPMDEIQKTKLKLLPENYEAARKALEIYDAKVQGSSLRIQLTADRGDGGLYRKGDKLYIFLKANLDCYARIIYHQVDGTKVLIFPNRFHPDSRIEKDRLYQIPPSGTAFSFEVVEPFGVEMIKVFAATSPIDLDGDERTAEGFSILKQDLAVLANRTRGLALKGGETLYAEDTVVINTLGAVK